MNPFRLAPATRMLAGIQAGAGFRRLVRRLRSPRRIVLSSIGAVLAAIWVGQAAVGVLFRESADPEKLRQWIPLSLTAYAVWHVVKVAFRKPVRPFEWTPAEEEWLLAAPIGRSELIRFRLAAIVRAAVFKSIIFSLVMIPDLHFLPFGFMGMLTGLLIIDLIRMLAEVVVWGLKNNERLLIRAVVATGMAAIAMTVLIGVLEKSESASIDSVTSIGFLYGLVQELILLSQTPLVTALIAPFGLITELILANGFSFVQFGRIVGAGATGLALFILLVLLDRLTDQRVKKLERYNLPRARVSSDRQIVADSTFRPQNKPARIGGLGPLCWRQMLGARVYPMQLAVALGIPMFLCCLPAISGMSGLMLVMNVTAGLAFYSFLLLPASMPFDMRRDLDRITVLKSLPIPPLRLVLGQLMAPVLLTTVFQSVTLGVVMLISAFHPIYFLISMSLLVPFNLFVFGLENLLILWYPYRMNQEGVQVFLRSILAFTAKGLLFAIAAAGILAWAFVAKTLGVAFLPGAPQLGTAVLFSIGGCAGLFAVSAGVIRLLANAFQRFDPSCDLVGID